MIEILHKKEFYGIFSGLNQNKSNETSINVTSGYNSNIETQYRFSFLQTILSNVTNV